MKIKYNVSLVILIVLIVAISSCNQSKYSKEIIAIDGLLSSLDSSNVTLLSLDTAVANTRWDSIKTKLKILKTYYDSKKDTVERKESFLVSDYYSLRKPFRTFTPDYKAALKEIQFSKDQLLALKQDFSNNLMKVELAKKHFLIETAATSAVVLSVKKLQKNMELNALKYDRLQPKIDSLLMVIMKINPIKVTKQQSEQEEGEED